MIALSVLVILGGLYHLKLQKGTAETEEQHTSEKDQVNEQESEQPEQPVPEAETESEQEQPEIDTDLLEPELQEFPETKTESDAAAIGQGEEKATPPAVEQDHNGTVDLTSLETTLQTEIGSRTARWSVVVVDLSNQQTIVCDNAGTAASKTTAASLIKLYVMAAAYDRIQAGLLADTDALEQSIGNMITVSSNEDTNAVLRAIGDGDSNLGMQRVNAYC